MATRPSPAHTRSIRRGKEFQHIFQSGKRGFAHGLRVVVAPAAAGHSRLGMAVSRKFGNAVIRNRARRLLREAFRLSHETIRPPLDVVVIPLAKGFPDTLAAVEALLHKAIRRARESAVRGSPAPPGTPPQDPAGRAEEPSSRSGAP